jgi:hypothetical protein
VVLPDSVEFLLKATRCLRIQRTKGSKPAFRRPRRAEDQYEAFSSIEKASLLIAEVRLRAM